MHEINTDNLKITLKEDKISYYNSSKMSNAERRKVKDIKDLLKNKFGATHSPFASAIIIIKNRNGLDRLCVDFMALNRIIVQDKFPLPLIHDQVDRLG